MTLFFDLSKLEKKSKGDPVLFVKILKTFYTEKISSKHTNIAGVSFLLSPAPLFSSKADILYIVQYIRLASARDYTMYKQYKVKGLPLSYFPDLLLENIKTNPLLEITKNEVLFIYE